MLVLDPSAADSLLLDPAAEDWLLLDTAESWRGRPGAVLVQSLHLRSVVAPLHLACLVERASGRTDE